MDSAQRARRLSVVAATAIGSVALTMAVVPGGGGGGGGRAEAQVSIERQPRIVQIAPAGSGEAVLFRLWSDGRIEAFDTLNILPPYTAGRWAGWKAVAP